MKKTLFFVAAGAAAIAWPGAFTASAAPRARFISHRGESIDAPENTMAAFRAAVERGADGFECDVYLTADNEIVCIHDATTKRTTDGDLTVKNATLAQLKALDAGAWKGAQFAGERIPTLAEALALARDNFEIYVEIKCGTEILPRLAEVLAAEPKATPERVVFIGFSASVITAVRQQFPAYRAYWLSNLSTDGGGALTPGAASVIATLQATGANGLDVQNHASLDAAYVSAVKDAGFSFHVWTVNSVPRAAELAAMGAETVTSDRGAALAAALAEQPEPVVWWDLDGGAATNRGSGGAAYNATLSGAVAFTDGIDGQGLKLPGGASDWASLAYTLGDQGTVALWYKPEAFYNHNTVFDNSADPNQWEMWIYDDGRLSFWMNGNHADRAEHNLNTLQNGTNQWYHFAVTWDRNAATNQTRLYVNGVEVSRRDITAWAAPGAAIYFGGHPDNGRGRGVLDDVRVYGAALTAGQVQAVHAEIASKAPVVHVTLDGTAANSGTGGARYDAVLNGGPAWTNGWNNKGQALALDGVDDYVAVPYRLNASGTVALWCYAPGLWYNYNSVFDNSAGGNHWEAWIDNTGKLQFRAANGQGTASYSLGSGSNRWYHIACTWDALSSNLVLYVNGVERGRAVNTAAWPTPGAAFYLGGGHSGNTFARNVSSDLQIFETPLSSSRVTEIYGEFGRRGGLMAYVPFDGTAVDVAGSNAVVVSGSPAYEKAQVGKGLRCGGAGTDDNASISNVLGSSVGTIALWYYARGPWYDYQTILDNSVFQEYWEGWIYKTGIFRIRVSNKSNGGTASCDLNSLRGPDNWYHIAFTWNRAEAWTKLYVDGVLRATASLTDVGWVDPDPTLHLAGGHPGNSKGNGVWDEVRVYDRALTAEEVEALTVIPPPPPPKGTIVLVK